MAKLLPFLRLVRVGTLFSPAADVVASVAVVGAAWTGALAGAVAASVCLYAAGMVWNDVADRRVDAEVRPERPLPSGAIGLPVAMSLGALLLAVGLWLSPCRLHHGIIAALVLLYDFVSKRVLWLGALNMGVLRGLNLGTALACVPTTAAIALDLRIAAICYGIYIVAVTILGHFEDTPNVRPRAVSNIQAAPLLAGLCGLWAVQGGLWPAPLLGGVAVLWCARQNARIYTWDRPAIRRAMTRLLLGTMLYTALLALAAGRPVEAAAIVLVIVPARWISRRIALT
ncbi:MAG: UbiA family prenyltransferase [Planctomycetes bacterium]|nr:UbiA family prenyltransferase [Planctomycetota bacterium]MCB9887214.1 UbiA family prenyltransferase [Planctomycetota bacterium]